MNKRKIVIAAALLIAASVSAQPKLTLQVGNATRSVSPTLYGLMTEEINFAYEGGLYSQLLRDPSMQENVQMGGNRRGQQQQQQAPRPTQTMRYWLLADTTSGTIRFAQNGGISFENKKSININLTKDGASVVNPGFWGIPVYPAKRYFGDTYIKGQGRATVGLRSLDGSKVFAQKEITLNSADWKQYSFEFTTPADAQRTKDAQFFITFEKAGNYSLAYTTLYPESGKQVTCKSNWFRQDIMDLLREMHPKFLRFPGGNYLEGNRFADRFDWKSTRGNVINRPGHRSPWGYWSTDGMGILEFLCWCEEMGAEPILGVFAGYVLSGDYVVGDALNSFIQDALDEIEYTIGSTSTKWGAERAKDGHPEPFKLTYVEIGNEDFFDRSGSYSQRFTQFYNAIKAKYPQLQIISTQDERALRGNSVDPQGLKVDVIDEHYYRNAESMYRAAQQYDSYDRNGVKIFCGEWATREGKPTTNMNAALGDAAWMTCMERNSDILVAHCYAPLFVNVNEGGMQWESDLIGYDAITSFGSPAYWAQVMFAGNLGDKVVPIQSEQIPTMEMGREPVPQLYFVSTRDTKTGKIYLKVVNGGATAQKVNVAVEGQKVSGKAKVITLKGEGPLDTNDIDHPTKITPQNSQLKVSSNFVLSMEPYSIKVVIM